MEKFVINVKLAYLKTNIMAIASEFAYTRDDSVHLLTDEEINGDEAKDCDGIETNLIEDLVMGVLVTWLMENIAIPLAVNYHKTKLLLEPNYSKVKLLGMEGYLRLLQNSITICFAQFSLISTVASILSQDFMCNSVKDGCGISVAFKSQHGDAISRVVVEPLVQDILRKLLDQEIDDEGNQVFTGDGIVLRGAKKWVDNVPSFVGKVLAAT